MSARNRWRSQCDWRGGEVNQITTTKPFSTLPVDYGIADSTIADLQARYAGLTIQTTADYEKVRLAIADVRGIRTGVEKDRKEIQADAKDFIGRVNAEAKRVTALLVSIETPLVAEKSRVDDERAAAKAAKEAEARAKVEAEIAEAKRIEDERIAAEQAAREAALAEQRAKLDAERAEMEAAQKALDERRREFEAAKQVELDRIASEREAEQAKVEAERLERERIEAERQAAIRAEQDRIAEQQRLEREQLVAERAEIERLERERLEAIERAEARVREAEERRLAKEAEAKRAAEMAPDREKAAEFVMTLDAIVYPKMSSEFGKRLIGLMREEIADRTTALSLFAKGEVSQ